MIFLVTFFIQGKKLKEKDIGTFFFPLPKKETKKSDFDRL